MAGSIIGDLTDAWGGITSPLVEIYAESQVTARAEAEAEAQARGSEASAKAWGSFAAMAVAGVGLIIMLRKINWGKS